MKKILYSLGGIAVVAAVVTLSTGAFFNDSELSEGNIFTAGSIDLQVDHSLASYNGVNCVDGSFANGIASTTCALWLQKDLTPQDKFWNFGDIKPGDYGTNVISLHVDTNDSNICLFTDDVVDNDNSVIEPEISAGDIATSTVGELSQYLKMFAWADDGDGVFEPLAPEAVLVTANSSFSTDTVDLALAGGDTANIGFAWCVGTQSVDGAGVISCDGSGDHNIAQTDSVTASLVAYAEQARHDTPLNCDEVKAQFNEPAPTPTPEATPIEEVVVPPT